MKKLILVCVTGVVLSFSSCTQPAGDEFSQVERDNLIKTHSEATKSVHEDPQHADWDAFTSAHYADDAILMPPNSTVVEGHDAIAAFFSSFPTFTKFHTEDVEIKGAGNMAFIRGIYSLTMQINDSTLAKDDGKYIEVWMKNDMGEWKCIRDIFNSDLPME